MKIGSVIQFNEKHKWCGSLGIICEMKDMPDNDTRYMIGVPIPKSGTAYIYVMDSDREIEYIGEAVLREPEVKE